MSCNGALNRARDHLGGLRSLQHTKWHQYWTTQRKLCQDAVDLEGSWVAGTGREGVQAPVADLGCDGALHGAIDDLRRLGSLRQREALSQCL